MRNWLEPVSEYGPFQERFERYYKNYKADMKEGIPDIDDRVLCKRSLSFAIKCLLSFFNVEGIHIIPHYTPNAKKHEIVTTDTHPFLDYALLAIKEHNHIIK